MIWRFITASIKNKNLQYKLVKIELIPILFCIILLFFIAAIMESIFILEIEV